MRTISRRLLLRGGVLTGALLLLIALPATAQSDCSLTVSPKSGPPGTAFVFTGTGFTTTALTLRHAGMEPRTIDASGADDPFKVRIVAGDSDVGTWRATAAGCSDPATIRVTLPPTSTVADALSGAGQDRTPVVAAFGLLGLLFVGASAFLLPRVARSLRAR